MNLERILSDILGDGRLNLCDLARQKLSLCLGSLVAFEILEVGLAVFKVELLPLFPHSVRPFRQYALFAAFQL